MSTTAAVTRNETLPPAARRRPSVVTDLMTLAKVRLNALVVFTSGAGYYLASSGEIDWSALALSCLGTALVASGAAALNQVSERDLDKLMIRTQARPVADGRLSPSAGVGAGLTMAGLGLAALALGGTLIAAAVALLTLLIYIGVYTPLKRRTSLATIVGAVPGALPPLIGWTAAGGSLASPAVWSLFAIMFFWQLPHFLAISWLYREDYGRAGLPMLAVIDRDGAMTGRQAFVWAAALVPASLVPGVLGLTGTTYPVGAMVLGFAFAALAGYFAARRTVEAARLLFLGSITYLPLLWILMGAAKR